MIIYKTTNLINGKIYIGKDEKNTPNYIGSGLLITRSIKKYGKENFKKEILETCLNKDELKAREQYWIKEYNSTDILVGYNITKGGDGGLTSSIEHLSKVSKKLWSDPEYVKKQMVSRKKRVYRQKGEYNHSKETKEKLKISHSGKTHTEEHKQNNAKANLEKRVYSIIKCVETNQIFKSINEAKRWLGKGDIQGCLDGKQKTAGGYHWDRLNEVKKRKNI
jgi:group I intron endonuclease